MPSIRYVNQTAPFWDWVASFEDQGSQHPLFSRGESSDQEAGSWGFWPGRHWHHGPMPHHPPPHHPHGPPHHHPHGPPPHHPHGPPPPPAPLGHPGEHSPAGPPPGYEAGSPDTMMGDGADKDTNEKRAEGTAEAGPSQPREDEPRDGCKNAEGGRRRGGCHRGPGSFKARRCGGGPGAWGRRGPFPFGGPSGQPSWPAFLQTQMQSLHGQMGGAGFFGDNGNNNDTNKDGEQADFKPELDVFDAEASYVVHVSLPGAKKEDVGVNWDPEKSELAIAGVVYRPGDEDFIKTLAMDGRKIGPFEATVRLGSRVNPAQVDADAITARLENGILVVEVPKLDKDYVEIKKVDIE